MSGVRMLNVFERLMEIHSNPLILYYGFKYGTLRIIILSKLLSSLQLLV